MSSHKHRNIVLMLLFINAHVYAVLGLHCLSCSEAVSPIDCDTVQLCSSHEICFIEVNVLNTGHIRYQMGCKDSKQCSRIQPSAGRREIHKIDSVDGKFNLQDVFNDLSKASSTFRDLKLHNSTLDVAPRRSRDLLVCSECCTNDLCNSAGCGQTGYISQRGPICFHCSEQMTPDDCNKITMCGDDQVCMVSKIENQMTHAVRYQTHCEEEIMCRATENIASFITGKRQLGSGSCTVSCCKTDLCNRQCNSTVAVVSSTPHSGQTFSSNSANTITPMLPNDPCLSNPCMRGTCSVDNNKYRCDCEPGYAGQQCGQVYSPTTQSALTTQTSQITITGLDACLSNPCMWGQCSPILTTYKCTCHQGYWGRNCEKGAVQVTPTSSGITTLQTMLFTTSHQGCWDGISYCKDYGPSVCTEPEYSQWVSHNCALTCNLCVIDHTPCFDGLRCLHKGVCISGRSCACRLGYYGAHCEFLAKNTPIHFEVGDVVVRGPDWNKGEEDGHGFGTVISIGIAEGEYVLWDNGARFYYNNFPGIAIISLVP